MRSVWFKARYVGAILSGEKRDTIRAKPPRFGVGEIVAASVGPIRPFALLWILSVDAVEPDSLDTGQRVLLQLRMDTEI